MILLISGIFTDILDHYSRKWRNERIDREYKRWEESQAMREEMGYDDKSFQRIPKRRIKNRAARKKHGY